MTNLFNKLDEFYGINELDEKTLALISNYEKDGQYVIATENELKEMPIDARWDAIWYSTYHACKLLLNYYLKGNKAVYEQFIRCLDRCISNGFMGEGFLGETDTFKILKELIELGLLEVIPLDGKEAKAIDKIIGSYRDMSEDYPTTTQLKELLTVYDSNIIFTYGTLMKGNPNHRYLQDEEYIGDSILNDYGLLELGYFPGAIEKEGYKVTGEVYKVTNKEKEDIDYLEGSLYTYKNTYTRVEGKLYYVGFYEYNYPQEEGSYQLRIPYGKWNKNNLNLNQYVWYVCYGSNLSYRRFMRYINRCANKSEPIAKENIILPYNIYFAGYTSIWDGAKAFLDTNSKGKSYCVKYLVTREQYESIKEMEGKDYRTKVDLGYDEFGIAQYSFTETEGNLAKGVPSSTYINEIKRGIKENFCLKNEEIDDYLNKRINTQV